MSGSSDNTIGVWEALTGKLVKIIRGHSDEINSIAFSPNGEILASGSSDSTIGLWSLD